MFVIFMLWTNLNHPLPCYLHCLRLSKEDFLLWFSFRKVICQSVLILYFYFQVENGDFSAISRQSIIWISNGGSNYFISTFALFVLYSHIFFVVVRFQLGIKRLLCFVTVGEQNVRLWQMHQTVHNQKSFELPVVVTRDDFREVKTSFTIISLIVSVKYYSQCKFLLIAVFSIDVPCNN